MKTTFIETVEAALPVKEETIRALVKDECYVDDRRLGKSAAITLRHWDSYTGWHVDIASDSEAVTSAVAERIKHALQGAVDALSAYRLGMALQDEIIPNRDQLAIASLERQVREMLTAQERLRTKVLDLEDTIADLQVRLCVLERPTDSIKKSQEEEEDYQVSFYWTASDVFSAAESLGLELSKEEARGILDRVSSEYSSSVGVNWDVIRSTIDEFMRGDQK